MDHLLFIGSVHTLFTAVFLITKRARSLNDTVLAVWMVFITLPLISGASVQTWPDIHIPILRADLIYPLTYGPFMWLYVGTLTGEIGRITQRHILHFSPFIITSIVQLATDWTSIPPNPEATSFSTFTRIIGAINLTVLLIYSVAIFMQLKHHDRAVVGHFSNLPNHITLGWIRGMTAGFTAVFLVLFLAAVLSLPFLLNIHLFALIISILLLSYFGLRQDQVFEIGNPHDCEPIKPKPRYDRSGLTSERAEVIARRLKAFMQTEHPYLDANLTIETLAKRIAVPRHHLTEVISEHYSQNFYLFINSYRIDAVQRAMKDPSRANETLLEIAYASGFNSKSPFNTTFKKLTGKTPSQYRRELA